MKTLKYYLIALVFIVLALNSCDHQQNIAMSGNGIPQTETRQITNFTNLEVSGAFKVNIVSHKTESLKVTADSNLLNEIVTEVKDGTLYIHNKTGIFLSPTKVPQITITASKIAKLSESGDSQINLSGVDNGQLNIHTSGASTLEISGKVEELNIQTQGATKINSQHLNASKVNVKVSGIAKVTVYAAQSLLVNIAGSGVVDYYGKPKQINQHISGQGQIRNLS